MKSIQNKTHAMKQVETTKGEPIEEVLRALYVDEHLSVDDISTRLNISYVTTLKWLKLAGVRSRRLKVRPTT